MALTPATGATPAQAEVDAQIVLLEAGSTIRTRVQVARTMADAYIAYSKEGLIPGAVLTAGGTKSILTGGFNSDPADALVNIAQAICDYWNTVPVPGIPAHGGTAVTDVVMDPAPSTYYSAMIAAINLTMTNQAGNGFIPFYTNTEAVVKTMTFTVTETVNGTPTDFVETIT